MQSMQPEKNRQDIITPGKTKPAPKITLHRKITDIHTDNLVIHICSRKGYQKGSFLNNGVVGRLFLVTFQ